MKLRFSIGFPSILLIGVATLVLCWPIFQNEALHHGDDVSFHVTWARGFIETLRDGNPYPRWDATINRGLGGPVFVFYPPLGFYLVALVNTVTGDLMASFRLVLVLVSFLTGVSFFCFAKHHAPTFWATLGAVSYVLLPYHAIDLYDRFAFAEYLAFLWIPILFIAIRRLANEEAPKAWPLLVLSIAGLLLTHHVTAFMALFVAGPYGFALLIRRKRWRPLLAITAGGFLGAACVAVYLFPAMAERKLVHLEWNVELETVRWEQHLLFHSPSGLDAKPTKIRPLVERAATRQIAVMMVSGALLLGVSWRRRSRDETFEPWLFFGLAAWTVFLQTVPSSPLWRFLPAFKTISFPWRFLLFHSFTISALIVCLGAAAAALDRQPAKSGRPIGLEIATRPGVLAGLIVVVLLPCFAYTLALRSIRPFTFSESLSQMPLYQERMVQEYIPSTVAAWEPIAKLSPPSAHARVAPAGHAKVLEWLPERRIIEVESPMVSTLTLWTFDYPGWRATVDGVPAEVGRSSSFATIALRIPEGRHRVELRFRSTKDRLFGAFMSAVALLAFAAIIALGRKRTPSSSERKAVLRRK